MHDKRTQEKSIQRSGAWESCLLCAAILACWQPVALPLARALSLTGIGVHACTRASVLNGRLGNRLPLKVTPVDRGQGLYHPAGRVISLASLVEGTLKKAHVVCYVLLERRNRGSRHEEMKK